MRKICLTALLTPMLLFVFISAAHAQSPQQTLTQYISDLQKSPNDYALRERIIKHVHTMRLAPVIPEEAKRYLVRGKAAFKGAKEARDFNDAAEEFKKALLYAPWLAEGYYNLGIIQDKAGLYADAMQSLKFYLMVAPNAPDTEKVKELIYEIEYRQEKAAKESSPTAIAAKQQNKAEEFFQRIIGARYVWHVNWVDYEETYSVDIYGDKVVFGATPTRISNYRNVPQGTSLGVYQSLWPCPITNKKMQGNDLVVEVGGCWGMQGYTVRNNGGSLTLNSTHYEGGYWQNAVFMRSR